MASLADHSIMKNQSQAENEQLISELNQQWNK